MNNLAHNLQESYHDTRFTFDDRREILWKALCDFWFSRYVDNKSVILELGAGYCHFINNISGKTKYALDLWDGVTKFAKPDVKSIVGSASELSSIENHSVDFVFASNLFEHLTKEQFAETLKQVRRILKQGGTVNILQPNYRFCYDEYFDDYTHVAVWSDRSIVDFIEANGYRVLESWPKFLPLTVKSIFPVSRTLIRLYLMLPFRPMGKQMFIRCTPVQG